jgi:glycosyltransferase involved in cell wall biosynthesis
MLDSSARPRLVVLASTYPRWSGDHEPSFVHALASRLTAKFEVYAIVPHAAGSRPTEVLDGVTIVRYRYAPVKLETLVNDGGIVTNLRRAPWKWVLVPGFIFMQWFAARRYMTKAAIVHAHWLVPQGVIARWLGRRYVITCHGADVFALRGRIASIAKRFAIGGASAIAVVSRAMVSHVQALGAVPDLTIVSPMGVDLLNTFTPDPTVERDAEHLLFVGRLVEKKGVDVLLHAFAQVLVTRPNLRLSVVGHGPLETSLRELSIRLGIDQRVNFIGPLRQSDIVRWYRKASLFVAPFRIASSGDAEGLGLVTIEALGCGCPVLASDVPASRDVLDGLPGVATTTPNDSHALATSLLQMLNNCEQLWMDALEARAILRDRFDWSSVAKRYGDLLERIAGHDA